MKEVRISEQKSIVIQKKKYKGNVVLDIRTFLDIKDGFKGYTKKGINIPAEKGLELLSALREVLDEKIKE